MSRHPVSWNRLVCRGPGIQGIQMRLKQNSVEMSLKGENGDSLSMALNTTKMQLYHKCCWGNPPCPPLPMLPPVCSPVSWILVRIIRLRSGLRLVMEHVALALGAVSSGPAHVCLASFFAHLPQGGNWPRLGRGSEQLGSFQVFLGPTLKYSYNILKFSLFFLAYRRTLSKSLKLS